MRVGEKEWSPSGLRIHQRCTRDFLHFDGWDVEKNSEERWQELRKQIEKHGLRNSLLIAIAPTATIASIAGCYECIEPQVSNLFKRETLTTLQNKYKVPHFDAKGESNRFFTDSGVPTTILNTVFYWENFIYFGQGPKKGTDGKIALTIPMADKKLPSIAAEDIGKCAYGIFKNGDKYIGKTVGIAGGHLTGKQFAEAFTKAFGKEVVYTPVTPEVYRGFGFPGADNMGNMYQFKAEFEADYCNSRSVELARTLNPALQNFESWLKENKTKIPLE